MLVETTSNVQFSFKIADSVLRFSPKVCLTLRLKYPPSKFSEIVHVILNGMPILRPNIMVYTHTR